MLKFRMVLTERDLLNFNGSGMAASIFTSLSTIIKLILKGKCSRQVAAVRLKLRKLAKADRCIQVGLYSLS